MDATARCAWMEMAVAKKSYEPNSFDGPVESGVPIYNGLAASGVSGATPTPLHVEDDEYACGQGH